MDAQGLGRTHPLTPTRRLKQHTHAYNPPSAPGRAKARPGMDRPGRALRVEVAHRFPCGSRSSFAGRPTRIPLPYGPGLDSGPSSALPSTSWPSPSGGGIIMIEPPERSPPARLGEY